MWAGIGTMPWRVTENYDHSALRKQLGPKIGEGILAKRVQCDQIGQFFKVLGDTFAYKSSPKHW